MMMKFKLFLIFCIFFLNQATAQDKVVAMAFRPVFGAQVIELGSAKYCNQKKDSIQINTLRFYISNVRLLNNNRVVWQEKNSFHLLDLEQPKTMGWNLVVPHNVIFSQVSFDLGIDSITNVSGALGGDLDPTKGMYWTWQSGYVNFKLEGKASSSSANKNEFQFHLGGYQYPFLACQQIVLDQTSPKGLEINFDLKMVLDQTDISKLHHIMSPSYEAVSLSQLLKESFSIDHK